MSKPGYENFNETVFINFCKYIYENCGIVVREDKKVYLGNRLRKRMKALELSGYEEYWNYLVNSRHTDENYHLYEVVTINETYFQRGNRHYKILSERVLPEFHAQKRSNINIWSCGTSTGEEAYDLSMLALDFEKDHPKMNISITGTDISKRVLDFARNGEYADRRISQLTENQTAMYFNEISPEKSRLPYAKKVLGIKSCLKEKVVFQYQNMISNDYITNVDVIFCRNVLIYFDKPTQNDIIDKFYSSLSHGGFLFLGYAETLHITPEKLTALRFPEGTIFKKES